METIDKSNFSEDKFDDLSYTDVQINLRLLSDLKEGERIMIVDNKFIQVDKRYFQSVIRTFTSDSRSRTLKFFEHIIDWSKKYCTEYVKNINMNVDKQVNIDRLKTLHTLLSESSKGMGLLEKTYGDDILTQAYLKTLRETIQVFCSEDFKKVISDKNKY